MIKLALVKLTSCSGCLFTAVLSIATSKTLAEAYEIVYSREIGIVKDNWFDLSLVEGSVMTQEQERFIKELRSRTSFMVALGTCAILGGVQSRGIPEPDGPEESSIGPQLDNAVSYPRPRPLPSVVQVEYAIPGCPVSDIVIGDFLLKYSIGGLPIERHENVCAECKRRGIECVLISRGVPCLGPVTNSGCEALCPSRGRGCYGCSGLRRPDLDSHRLEVYIERLGETSISREDVETLLTSFGYDLYRRLVKR